MTRMMISTAFAALLAAGPAMAQTTASATTDLNIRSGPGVQHEVVGVIDTGASVDVRGCIAAANWCQVSFNGTEGWAYGDYLTTMVAEAPITLAPVPERDQLVTVIEDDSPRDNAVGAGMGAAAGALIVGGPLAVVGGAIAGAIATDILEPDTTVTTYVTENPVDPIILDGEVVVGAGIPAEIDLFEVPDSEFVYHYINGVPVIVEPGERRIVRIVR